MCYYITIAVHNKYEELLTDQLSTEYSVLSNSNPFIKENIPDSFKPFLVIQGMCSCSLFSRPEDYEIQKNKIEKKYEKKRGIWSDSKIARATSESLAALKNTQSGLCKDLRIALHETVLRTRRIFILVHWYSGNIETECFEIRNTKHLKSDCLINEENVFEEDSLIELNVE